MRLIQNEKIELVIIEPDQIGLNVIAALADEEAGDLALPNAIFEVRIGVEKVYEGVSDLESGRFLAQNIPVGKFGSRLDISIYGRDEGGYATFKTQLSTEVVMLQIDAIRRGKSKSKLSSPEEEAERARQLKESIQKALDDLESNNESVVKAAFKVLVEHQDHPLVKREIANAAKKHSEQFIQHANLFYGASWAEEILMVLGDREPQKILGKLKEFYRYNWAKNVVGRIASNHDHSNLAFSEIRTYEYMPWAEKIAMRAAKINPWSAVEYYDKYMDQPWADGVFDFAKQEIEQYEAAARREAAQQEARAKIGRKIDATCALFSQPHSKEDEENAFKFFVENQHDDRMENALNVLVGNFPEVFLKHFQLYWNASWGKTITEKLVECYPLARHNLLLERAYGKKITSESLLAAFDYAEPNNNLGVFSIVCECIEKLENCSWIRDFLLIVAKKLEAKLSTIDIYCLKRMGRIYAKYEEEPWSKKILGLVREEIRSREEEVEWKNRAKNDPANTVAEVLSHHINKRWADRLLRDIYEKNPEVGRLIFNLIAVNSDGRELVAVNSDKGEMMWRWIAFRIVRRDPHLVLEAWPINATDRWADMIVDEVSGHYMKQYGNPCDNKLIKFCLENPDSAVTEKFIARLKVTNPKFVKLLVPNPVWAFIKALFK